MAAIQVLEPHPSVRNFLSGGTKKLLIAGQWTDAASGKTFETFDPATGAVIARVAEGGAADIERAVVAARAALPAWAKISPAEREKLLHRLADLVEKNAAELASLETINNGKPIRESQNGDLPLAAALLRYFAGWPTKISGDTVPVSVPYFPGARFLQCPSGKRA